MLSSPLLPSGVPSDGGQTVLRIFAELIHDEVVWEDHLQPKFADIFNLISMGLQDPDNAVRVGALKCVIALLAKERNVTVPEFRAKIVNDWLPVVMQVMKYCIETGNDQVAQAFEVICRLAEQDFENLAPFVPNIVNFMLDIAHDAGTLPPWLACLPSGLCPDADACRCGAHGTPEGTLSG